MRKFLCRPHGAKSCGALYEFGSDVDTPIIVDLEPGGFYEISEEGSEEWQPKEADETGEIGLILFPEGFGFAESARGDCSK